MADKHTNIKGARLQLSSDAERLGPTSTGEGWDSYKRWLAQMSSPGPRRQGFDDSVYTWNGYRDWMNKVKRDWDDES
jgi:hypothetical protein